MSLSIKSFIFPLSLLFGLLVLCGAFCFRLSNYDLAKTFFSYANDLSFDESGLVEINFGTVAYKEENYTKAINYFNQAIKKLNNGSKPHYLFVAKYNIGNSYFRDAENHFTSDKNYAVNQCVKAIQSMESATELEPEDVNAKENLEFISKKCAQLLNGQGNGNSQNSDNSTQTDNSEVQDKIDDLKKQEEEEKSDASKNRDYYDGENEKGYDPGY